MPISYTSGQPTCLRIKSHPKVLYTRKDKTIPESPPTLTAHSTTFPDPKMHQMSLGELYQWRAKVLEKFQREGRFQGDITHRKVVLALTLDAIALAISKAERDG